VWDQTLEDVLSDIEQILGLTFIVDSNIKSVPLSGVYNNITVCEFFSYAVKEKNITVSVNSEQNIITISKIRPSKNNHGDSLACEMESITQAQQSTYTPSNKEMRELETDRLTGKAWYEVEEQVRPSENESKSSQSLEGFLASEMEYIIQAQKSFNTPSNKEMRELETDRLTGKAWYEVEEQVRLSAHESKNSQLSQADFLASESDYITKVKMRTKNEHEPDTNEGKIDPMSGKYWEEIEAETE
jgi:hypothetical protein